MSADSIAVEVAEMRARILSGAPKPPRERKPAKPYVKSTRRADREAVIKGLLGKGLLTSQIAAQAGCCVATVQRTLRALGIPAEHNGQGMRHSETCSKGLHDMSITGRSCGPNKGRYCAECKKTYTRKYRAGKRAAA